jgi:hypothetical protein
VLLPGHRWAPDQPAWRRSGLQEATPKEAEGSGTLSQSVALSQGPPGGIAGQHTRSTRRF